MKKITFQNLNDKPGGKQGPISRHGRCWIDIGKPFESPQLEISWTTGRKECSAQFYVGGQYSDYGQFGFNVALPFLFSLYFSFYRFVPSKWLPDSHESFQTGFYILGGALWTQIWYPEMSDWSSQDKWYQHRCWSFNPIDFIFGSQKCNREEFAPKESIEIAMPEGTYGANLKFEHFEWKRSRLPFFKKERYSVWANLPIGIMFPGKGENSWDCGMDGLYGTGAEYGGNKAEAIANIKASIVKSVMRNRERYGGPGWTPTKEQYEEHVAGHRKGNSEYPEEENKANSCKEDS